MIVNNTQANIFKVNGGLADNFANRPTASGSFYIFYSIDTQEIYYDNGAWILIGSGGGTPINIYNSNGTLTGNRVLQGANNSLTFQDCSTISLQTFGNNKRFVIDNVKEQYIDLSFNNLSSGINNGFRVEEQQIKSYSNGFNNIIGLKLDFANQIYQFGDLQNGVYVDNGLVYLGDYGNLYNYTYLIVDSTSQLIATSHQGNIIGLKLDFANQQYILGNASTLFSIYIDDNLKNVRLGDQNINFNGTAFELDDTAQFIRTIGQTSINGLYFDFANSIYQFGQITGNNTTYLQINDANETLQTQSSGNLDGLDFDFANEIFKFGQIASSNGIHVQINGFAGIDTLQTIYNNNNQGIDLQFNNDLYRFGHMVGGNQTQINVIDNSKAIILESCINIPGEEVKYIINGGINALIKTQYQQNDIGLKLDFANDVYQYGDLKNGLYVDVGFLYVGDYNNYSNNTYLTINTVNQLIQTSNQGNDIGLKLDFANTTYQFGQLTGANSTYLTIDDAAAFPVQIDGTNVIQGTSGAVSGDHLKVKINGVDYVIELKNP